MAAEERVYNEIRVKPEKFPTPILVDKYRR